MSESGLLAMQLSEWWEAAIILGTSALVLVAFTIVCWRYVGKSTKS